MYTYARHAQGIVRDRRHIRKNTFFSSALSQTPWSPEPSILALLVWGGRSCGGVKTPTTPPNAFDGTFSTDRRFRKFAGSVTCARNCTWYHDRNALTRRARPACKRICKFGFAECLEAMEVKKKKDIVLYHDASVP